MTAWQQQPLQQNKETEQMASMQEASEAAERRSRSRMNVQPTTKVITTEQGDGVSIAEMLVLVAEMKTIGRGAKVKITSEPAFIDTDPRQTCEPRPATYKFTITG